MTLPSTSLVSYQRPISVCIPEGSKIRFFVTGEKDSADLTPFAAMLLRGHANLALSELPDLDPKNGVEFGTLSADENVTFICNGEIIDQDLGLRALAEMLIVSMVASLGEIEDDVS